MASLVIHDDLDRSASPPGREAREDWRATGDAPDGAARNGRSRSPIAEKRDSRSRSPLRRGRKDSPSKETRYAREGTNTTSREPHLERARLFVGNIEPNRTHRRDLVKLFSSYGEVLGVSIHKGYAFVQMDRERTANKAVNYEDSRNFMGSEIHVEFSQAALKAGAKYERLPEHSPTPPTPPHHHSRDRERYPQPQPPPPDSYFADEQERLREERLSRILQMEREIAVLRTHEVDSSRKPPRQPDSQHDSYDRRDSYRRSPGPVNSHGYESYSRDRDRDPPYRDRGGDRGAIGGSRGIYSRLSPTPGDHSRGSGGNGPYREQGSYPSQFSSGGSSYSNRNAPGVGYGSQGGKGSTVPPGWPSGSHDKANGNRPPFTNTGPWS